MAINKTVYDWILTHGQQVDFWHGVYKGWFKNDCAEEYANTWDDPVEKKLNGVVVTFEILEFLKQIPLPDNAPIPFDTEQFWEDLYDGKFLKKGNGNEIILLD